MTKPRQKIAYLATHNAHKVLEFQQIAGEAWKILPLTDLDQSISWEETGTSFVQNATIKAKAVKAHTPHPVIADDSGLCVDALNGAPGVYSSRYAGIDGDDTANNTKLLQELSDVPEKKRQAAFHCALVYIDENNQVSEFMGKCPGTITLKSSGNAGFGYDPLFIPDGYDQTFADLDADIKNEISHRKKAIEQWEASQKA